MRPSRAGSTGAGRRSRASSSWRRCRRTRRASSSTSRGLGDVERVGALAHWAGGSPLALTLAAAAAADPAWRPSADDEVLRTLVRRLVEAELDSRHRDVLGVASIARVTTVELLRDVLPEADPAEALGWLERRSFAEPLGGGVTLHELVRRGLHADLRQREPERERDLRLRIAESLYARAVDGRPLLTVDLAELVEAPALRAFYSWEGSVRNRIDSVRDGDAEQVALLLAAQGKGDWWPSTRALFEQAPELVAIARDPGDALCGFAISATPAGAPAVADADPVLGPVLRHARTEIPDGNAIIWRDAIDFTGGEDSRIQAMINMSGVLRSGLANPRFAYLPVDPALEGLQLFLSALGARHVPELDVAKADGRQEFHLVDYGEGGLLGAQRDMVYLELGTDAAELAAARAVAAGDRRRRRRASGAARLPAPARARRRTRSRALTATSRRGRRRCAFALEDAAERAFGDDPNEQLLQRVLVRGYLDPAASHEQAADELNLSRAAYFRRLKLASERVAEYLAGSDAG